MRVGGDRRGYVWGRWWVSGEEQGMGFFVFCNGGHTVTVVLFVE